MNAGLRQLLDQSDKNPHIRAISCFAPQLRVLGSLGEKQHRPAVEDKLACIIFISLACQKPGQRPQELAPHQAWPRVDRGIDYGRSCSPPLAVCVQKSVESNNKAGFPMYAP